MSECDEQSMQHLCLFTTGILSAILVRTTGIRIPSVFNHQSVVDVTMAAVVDDIQ